VQGFEAGGCGIGREGFDEADFVKVDRGAL
jgi:hypothetical protein